jgi:nucleoside-diphosphate-sugar epimerase
LPTYTAWDVARGPISTPEVDAVVHAAALVGDWGPEAAYRAVNVEGTRFVLESFANAPRFIHVSTTTVYSDDVVKHQVREDASVGDCEHSAYGRTKAESEGLVRDGKANAVILRPHIVYGPGDTTLLPRLLAARRLGWLAVPGDGRNRVSVTHVGNLVLAVQRALETTTASGTFNIADGAEATVRDLLQAIMTRLGAPTRLIFVPRALAWQTAAMLERAWPRSTGTHGPPLTRYAVGQLAADHTLDITRARCILGYEPRWTYRDGPLR